MRLNQSPSARDRSSHTCQLNWRDGDGSLAYGNRNRLAGVPFVVIGALDPFFGRHESRFFARQIDSRAMAESESRCVERDLVNSELFADVVEEDIARIHDCGMKPYNSVSLWSPAVKRASIKDGGTRAVRGEIFRNSF